MGAIRAVTPYVREVLWSTPLNIAAGVFKSLEGIPAGLGKKTLEAIRSVDYTGFIPSENSTSSFAPWLGSKIHELGRLFFNGGIKECLAVKNVISETLKGGGKLSMEVLSKAIGELGLKGGAFGALFLLGAGAISYMGWNVFKGEHRVLKDLSNGYPGDPDERRWVHWGKFLSGTAMLAGGLSAIFAPAIAPPAFAVAITALVTDKVFDFFRWLSVGGHWFNIPLKAPLGLSSYLRQNNYNLRA